MTPRTLLLTALALVCFAGNSLLCRVALRSGRIDAASFTTLRLASGALALLLILWLRNHLRRGRRAPDTGADGGPPGTPPGSAGPPARRQTGWGSAVALFAYAAAFSSAYRWLPAGTGALLLFGAVQVTMVLAGLRAGERPRAGQWIGLGVALAGLVALVTPGLDAPPIGAALLMVGAGVSWGFYSLQGRAVFDPTAATAGNFLRSVPLTVALSAVSLAGLKADSVGAFCAILSGAVTSGCGYVIWYAALPGLGAFGAASVQLATPVLAAIGGILLLGEALTLRLFLATPAVLGGIALVLITRGAGRTPLTPPAPRLET